MSKKIYQTVLLGALIHDIGKFIQMGDFGDLGFKGKHQEILATFIRSWGIFLEPWVDMNLLNILVLRHHGTSAFSDLMLAQKAPPEIQPYCLMVSCANNYSSEDRDSDADVSGDNKTMPLTSVFTHIKLRKETESRRKFYDTIKFSPEYAFPKDEARLNPAKTASLVKEFVNVMALASKTKWTSFRTFYSHLIMIIEDYCWCLPSNIKEELSDVSMYDHLRTTAAIAATLYKYHETCGDFSIECVTDDAKDKFLLLAGDLSGIQRYIYDISAIGAGGVAKRLRARSFYVTLVSTGLAYKIINDLELLSVNIITLSGGNFYILLPNTAFVIDYIARLRLEVNRDFLNMHGGELSLNLAMLPFAGQDFHHYNKLQRRVGEKLSMEKLNPLNGLLSDENGFWRESTFELDQVQLTSAGYCKSCEKLPASSKAEEDGVCTLCGQDLIIGKLLPISKFLWFFNKKQKDQNAILLPGGLWGLLSNEIPINKTDIIAGCCFGEIDIAKVTDLPVFKKFWSNHIPNIGGQPCDFDAIAAVSSGRRMLGVVKADVDNLGALFSIGLGEQGTISRVATLSRLLETFFSGWLNNLLVEKYPDIYQVYSGGDDLLAVGPWDQTMSLITRLREDFTLFVGENPDITLSAGIAVIKPDFPISRAVSAADENLDKAKGKSPKIKGDAKNQCSLLGETVKWGNLPYLLKQGKILAEWLEQGLIPTRFVHNLLFYGQMFDLYMLEQKVEGLKYIPLLNYDLNRNIKKDEKTIGIYKWVHSLTDVESISIQHLSLIARYALLARRVNNAR